jgi:hypothetical protein
VEADIGDAQEPRGFGTGAAMYSFIAKSVEEKQEWILPIKSAFNDKEDSLSAMK